MKPMVLVFCVASAVTSQARADWQYTKWGMSPQSAVTVSKGALSLSNGLPGDRLSDDSDIVGAVGTYGAGSRRFRAVLYFHAKKLDSVWLKLDGECGGLSTDLTGLYGKPFSESHGIMSQTVWQDTRKNNRVTLSEIGDCTLKYDPLKSSENNGL